jgi:MarR family 2-MHQ and catechol resistance regulon transcriptional repressor
MPTRPSRGAPRDALALGTLLKLARAHDTLAAALQREAEAHGLTLPQLAVLEALLHLGPMSQGELGRKLLRSQPNMTAALSALQALGWVSRERKPEDRRVLVVSLTPEGREVVAEAFAAHAHATTALLGALSAPEQEELGRLCRKLGLAVAARLADAPG